MNLIRLYEFDTLDDVIAAAHGLNGYFTGINTLYKDPADDIYKLVIHQSSMLSGRIQQSMQYSHRIWTRKSVHTLR